MDNSFILHIKQHWKYYVVGLILVIIITTGLVVFMNKPDKKSEPQKQAEVTKPKKELDPLQIEAIRAREYKASPIITEQNLGNQGGYTNAIISYQSDGNKIYALQSMPSGAAPLGGWPVVILDHGYIDPAVYRTNDGSYREFIALLARNGFVVIKPDYRGHGTSQGSPEGGHFSPAYTYDNLNLLASLKQYPLINSNRIGLVGHSLGAHVALRTIVVSKDVKATVMVSGVVGSIYDILYNWPQSPMPHDRPTALITNTRQKLIEKYGDPKSNASFWNSVSAINYVDAVTSKIQIHHSIADSTVPKLFSDHLAQVLQKAGKPAETYTNYPGDDHQFSTNRALLLQRMLRFYQENL